MPPLNLADLELELIDILTTQGLPVEEIRLIGLLGKGTRATVFSALIDGDYHVLKVYDSKDSLQAELKNLRKVIPKDRFLFSWQEKLDDDRKINLAIIEVPEGTELSSNKITDSFSQRIADRLVELHSIRYRQRVSHASLIQRLDRYKQPFLDHIAVMGRDLAVYENLWRTLKDNLRRNPDLFRTNKVRIHGDLWWPNIIAAKEDAYLIDWESMRRGDACEDIAKLRVYIYGYRTPAVPTFFWDDVNHAPRIGELVATIVNRHETVLGDTSLRERLKFYLPLWCIEELGNRYMFGADTQKAMNKMVADDALSLAENPLAAAPDLSTYGYFNEIEAERYKG